jgi:hypothetical protein
MLPFALASTREKIQNFTGPATILHPRVICMKPNILNLTFSDSDNRTVSGRIQPPSFVPYLQFDPKRNQNAYDPFSCLVQSATDIHEWAMSLCEPNSTFKDRILTNITGDTYFPSGKGLKDYWYIIMSYTNFSDSNVSSSDT